MSEEQQNLVNAAADKLVEHFDSVRIFVTKHDGYNQDSASFTTGRGNFYAQIGQINEWKAIQDQSAREESKKG